MSKAISRRTFLKASAISGLSAAAAGVLSAGVVKAAGRLADKLTVPERVMQSIASPSAAPLPSLLPLGGPLVDIAKGWDGTLFGCDENGIPYHYAPAAQEWKILGNGTDIVARWNATDFFAVRGAELSTATINAGAPKTLSEVFHNLPESFAQGLDGAAHADNTLYLFRSGRYVAIDLNTMNAGAPNLLTTLAAWPAEEKWQHGVVDAVGGHLRDTSNPEVLLWSKGEYVRVDMAQKKVVSGPHPLTFFVQGQMLAGMQQGFDSMLWDETNYEVWACNGAVQLVSSNRDGTASAHYAGAYAGPWAPIVNHAPAGTAEQTWAARRNSPTPIAAMFNGDFWQDFPIGDASHLVSVDVGVDGSVFAFAQNGLFQRNTTTGVWTSVFTPPFSVLQCAVCDASHIWLLDPFGDVYHYNGIQAQLANLGIAATHIAAGTNGALWHTAGNGNLYRFVPESGQPSTQIAPGVPAGSILNRVASTGFGMAYALDQTTSQVFPYTTPFTFKTSTSYMAAYDPKLASQSMTVAGGKLFLSVLHQSVSVAIGDVVALDAQSGVELWRFVIPVGSGEVAGTSSVHVYDAALDMLYVVSENQIHALDAVTGSPVWKVVGTQLSNASNRLQSPALVGTMLLVGNRAGKLIAIDTNDALRRGKQSQTPVALWVGNTRGDVEQNIDMGLPALHNDVLYIMTATYLGNANNRQLVAMEMLTGERYWQQEFSMPTWNAAAGFPLDVIVGNTVASDGVTNRTALFVNCINTVLAVDPASREMIHSYAIPQLAGTPAGISSGMTYRHDRLYFGDTKGVLYVLNALNFNLFRSTAGMVSGASFGVGPRPVLVASNNASDGVIAIYARGDNEILLFDPASGNLEHLAIDRTPPAALAYDEAHGVLYTLAWNAYSAMGQVFGIRVDKGIQDERSFVIESELMQDYGSDAEVVSGGVSRYHTHVTVVDDNKTPRGGSSVKLWADEENTIVAIDGTPSTIGPNTPAYLTTDGSGSFTIVSTADDLSSTTLRLWAPFMDEHERIAIVPDAAFHGRLSATTANGTDDPQKIDLVSAQSYDGNPLFADPARAQQAAVAIGQLTGSTGMGASAALMRAAGAPCATDKYITYPEYPGSLYTPINVSADRDVSAQMTLGFRIDLQGHANLTSAAAADLIDQMTGAEPVLLGGFLSSLRSAWHEIKQTAAQVVQVVVSVAKDIYAGIKYVVNGVEKVVKAVVQDVRDAAAAIGSFFVSLGKEILKVVQALSKFLRLGKVLATTNLIRGQVTGIFANLQGQLDLGKGLINTALGNAEATINNAFEHIYSAIGEGDLSAAGAGTPLNQLQGAGATPSSIYNQSAGAGQSQAVECGWSMHVLRNNLDNITTDEASAAALDDSLDKISNAMNVFIDTLKSDPELSKAYDSVGTSFRSTFKVTSPEELMKMLLKDLLEIFQAIAVTGLALTKALVNALLASTADIVDALKNIGFCKIPILSQLWRLLTGNDLTFVDLVAFVFAFPVTYIYRAIAGIYPGDEVLAADGAAVPKVVKNVMTLVGALSMCGAAYVTAVLDLQGIKVAEDPQNTSPLSKAWLAVGVALLLGNIGVGVFNVLPEPNTTPWTPELLATAVLSLLVPVIKLRWPQASTMFGLILSNLNIVFVGLKAYANGDSKATLTRGILAQIPGVLGPTKYLEFPLSLIAPAADFSFRMLAGAIQMEQAILAFTLPGDDEGYAQPWVYRKLFPIIANDAAIEVR